MARKSIAGKTRVEVEGKPVGVQFDFENGEQVKVLFDDLPASILPQLTAHGLMQKIGDSYSGSKGDIRVALENAKSVVEALMKGEWNVRGEGDGGMLVIALIEYFQDSKDEDEVREAFKGMDDDKRKALRKHPKIKAIMARLALERADAAAEDAEDLEI